MHESIVPKPIPLRHLSDSTWKQLVKSDLMSGSQEAKIKIVEFFDYECPYCRRIQPTLDEIRRRYPNDVAIIYRHFPLPYHSAAYPSAIASECANEQGKFESYHAALFEHHGFSKSLNWTNLAMAVGIDDLMRFQECVNLETYSGKITHDMQLAESVQISGVPTLIVEGNIFEGIIAVNELDKIIQDAIQIEKNFRTN